MGGTPGNALSLGWQRCYQECSGIDKSIKATRTADRPTPTGRTTSRSRRSAAGSDRSNIAGYAYEYADGLNTALKAYNQLNIPMGKLTVALRTDEQTLFCTWKRRTTPTSTSGTRRAATSSRGSPSPPR